MFVEGKLVETERVIIEAGISNLRNMNESGRQTLFVSWKNSKINKYFCELIIFLVIFIELQIPNMHLY